jgi:hypothetical protein
MEVIEMSNYIKSLKRGYYAFSGVVLAAAVVWTLVALHTDGLL